MKKLFLLKKNLELLSNKYNLLYQSYLLVFNLNFNNSIYIKKYKIEKMNSKKFAR